MQQPPTVDDIKDRLFNKCDGVECFCGARMYCELVDLVDGEHVRWTCDNCGQSWTEDEVYQHNDEAE